MTHADRSRTTFKAPARRTPSSETYTSTLTAAEFTDVYTSSPLAATDDTSPVEDYTSSLLADELAQDAAVLTAFGHIDAVIGDVDFSELANAPLIDGVASTPVTTDKTLVFTKNDRTMLQAIHRLGPLTGAHLALAVGKKYESKKGRISQLEKQGLLVSKLAYGIKIYNLTREGLDRISLPGKPAPFPDRLKWRHNFVIATQVLMLENMSGSDGNHILGPSFASNPLPVITEKTLMEHAATKWDKQYRDDLYRREWRKECSAILTDDSYPVVDAADTPHGVMTDATRKALLKYWLISGGGSRSAAHTHWDDAFTFGAKKKDGKNASHKRRADAVIPMPHVRTGDGTLRGNSIAVEVELSRKSIDEYVDIITQWADHPLINTVVYVCDDSLVISALKAAMARVKENGVPEGFRLIRRKPIYLNLHLDSEGYFG